MLLNIDFYKQMSQTVVIIAHVYMKKHSTVNKGWLFVQHILWYRYYNYLAKYKWIMHLFFFYKKKQEYGKAHVSVTTQLGIKHLAPAFPFVVATGITCLCSSPKAFVCWLAERLRGLRSSVRAGGGVVHLSSETLELSWRFEAFYRKLFPKTTRFLRRRLNTEWFPTIQLDYDKAAMLPHSGSTQTTACSVGETNIWNEEQMWRSHAEEQKQVNVSRMHCWTSPLINGTRPPISTETGSLVPIGRLV